jgi:hypothetical protein
MTATILLVLIVAAVIRFWSPIRQLLEWADRHDGMMTALATIIIAIFTALLVYTSHRQWQIMHDQLTLSEAPNVNPGKQDGTMGELVTPNGNQKTGVLLYFHNGGQGPALNFNVQLFNLTGSTTEQHMARFADDAGRVALQMAGGIAIPPNSDRKAVFNDWISDSAIAAAGSGKSQLNVTGLYEYCDELGRYTCKEFMGRYEPGLKLFSVVITNSCRYAYPPMNAWLPQRLHYMMPCEQPDERQREDAEEHDFMIKYMPSPIPAWTLTPAATPTPK